MITYLELLHHFQSPVYDFLKTNNVLGDNIILLGLGGSRAYGTDIESSDWDCRGVATRSAEDILTGRDWEQSVNTATDTTIYSFDKLIKLLCSCNPNTVEILGLKPEHYIKITDVGQELLNNKQMFLSKKAVNSFGGYALAQLNRLVNKSGRKQEEVMGNETRSINKAIIALRNKNIIDKNIKFYEADDEIRVAIDSDMSLESFIKLYQAVDNVHTDYRTSSRNNKAIEHGKLAKHQMHLIRLYFMALDILEKGEINTYREKEHDFLMDVRNGKYLENETTPTKEFMDMVYELDNRMKVASETTDLPDFPDMNKVHKFVEKINKNIVIYS